MSGGTQCCNAYSARTGAFQLPSCRTSHINVGGGGVAGAVSGHINQSKPLYFHRASLLGQRLGFGDYGVVEFGSVLTLPAVYPMFDLPVVSQSSPCYTLLYSTHGILVLFIAGAR